MDQYERIRKIGEGSFGKALLVKRKADGKQYVIKEINTSKMGRKEREDSKKEVRVLSQMKHSNIVAYLESFEERGNLYIVMDYCDGGDLYKKINEQKGRLIEEDKILNWFVQICLGLKHVHDRKILHRDIKTQNIFLTKSGVIKLGDFGIARVLNSTMELARTCIGTPYYLSPEICENRPYNNKSDVWALGCVLYELSTLKHAFEAGNMRNLVLKIVRGSYPAISTRYTRNLRSLVDSCLKHVPRERPSVNAILRMPFIQKRIENFLSETVHAEEFSHTVLHRDRGQLRGPRPAAVGGKQVSGRRAAQPSQPIGVVGRALPPQPVEPPKIKPPPPRLRHHQDDVYKPAGGVAKEKKKNVIVRPRPRPANPPAKKPISAGLLARKKDAEAKANRYQADVEQQHAVEAKLEYQMYARKQAIRRQQAKYDAANSWKSTLSSSSSAPLIKDKASSVEKKEKPVVAAEGRPLPPYPSKQQQVQRNVSVQQQAEQDREKAVEASERARLVSEFRQRKNEAARNKARGEVLWMKPLPLPLQHLQQQQQQPPPQLPDRRSPRKREKEGRNKAEEEYLSRLREIRQRNYQDRKRIEQKRLFDQKPPSPEESQVKDPSKPSIPQLLLQAREQPGAIDADERRRKIAALKAQADLQAEAMRKKLEEKRQERVAAVKALTPPSVRRAGPGDADTKVQDSRADQEGGGAVASPRKVWGVLGAAGGPPPVLARQVDATGVISGETLASNIVFEHPSEPVLTEEDDTSTESPRREWNKDEGQPLAAILQNKTLQTATYAVSSNNGGGETRIVFSKLLGPNEGDAAAGASGGGATSDPKVPSQPDIIPLSGVAGDKTPEKLPQSKDGDDTSPGTKSVSEPPDASVNKGSIGTAEPGTQVKGPSGKPETQIQPEGLGGKPDTQVQPGKPRAKSEDQSQPNKPNVEVSTFSSQAKSTPVSVKKEAWIKFDTPVVKDQQHGAEERSTKDQGNDTTAKTQGEDMIVEDIELEESSSQSLQRGRKQGSTHTTPTKAMGTPNNDDVTPTKAVDISHKDNNVSDRVQTSSLPPIKVPSVLLPRLLKATDLSASIKDGAFDTKAKLLRTCSLPDLSSVKPTEDDEESSADSSSSDEDETEEEEMEEVAGAVAVASEEEGPMEVLEAVEIKSKILEGEEKTMEGDDEEVEVEEVEAEEEEEDEDEEWSSEDEDLHQLVQTLQHFVEDSKSPVNTPKTPLSPRIRENWEDSDEGGSSSSSSSSSLWAKPRGDKAGGKKKKGGGKENSVFSNLEGIRVALEDQLGLDTMLKAYDMVQTFYEDDAEPLIQAVDEAPAAAAPNASQSRKKEEVEEEEEPTTKVFPMEELTTITGDTTGGQLCKKLIHLVMADLAYVEIEKDNDETDFFEEEMPGISEDQEAASACLAKD